MAGVYHTVSTEYCGVPAIAIHDGLADAPLVVITRSAALSRLGKADHHRGVYAGRALRGGDVVGRANGILLGTFDTELLACSSEIATTESVCGNDKLIVLPSESRRGAFDLVDGSRCGAPYLSLMNDPRGTRLKANVALEGREFVTLGPVPAFTFDLPLQNNAQSELLWDYGPCFWTVD